MRCSVRADESDRGYVSSLVDLLGMDVLHPAHVVHVDAGEKIALQIIGLICGQTGTCTHVGFFQHILVDIGGSTMFTSWRVPSRPSAEHPK
jgi:hypothetical protein